MQRNLLVTKDGSHTIQVPAFNVCYHSIHGAVQESLHVFIEAGLKDVAEKQKPGTPIKIFEMGFGTGLNALITLTEAERLNRKIYYETTEAFPLEETFIQQLNYCKQLLRPDLTAGFQLLHSCNWETVVVVSPHFIFKKINQPLINYSTDQLFNLLYYDAFAPNAQPELWTEAVFKKLFNMLEPGGLLVTYCSKGDVRRAMQAAGFTVEKLKGPPGKREMLRGVKLQVDKLKR